MSKALLATIGLVVIGGAAAMFWQSSTPEDDLMTPLVNAQMHGVDDAAPARPADQIVVPKFSSAAQMGKIAFDENCSACHGENAAGSENGPPLIHTLYRTGHHPDAQTSRGARHHRRLRAGGPSLR